MSNIDAICSTRTGQCFAFICERVKASLITRMFDTVTGKMIPVNGAIVQKQDNGFGTFLGTNETGQVFIGSQQ